MTEYVIRNNTPTDLEPDNIFWTCASNSKAEIVKSKVCAREFKTIKQIEKHRLASK